MTLMDKKLARYKELQELSSVSLVDTMKIIKKMVDANIIKRTPTKMIVTRSMFETAQRMVLEGNNVNQHEKEVDFK